MIQLQKQSSQTSQSFSTLITSHHLLPLPCAWVRTAQHMNSLHLNLFCAFSRITFAFPVTVVSALLFSCPLTLSLWAYRLLFFWSDLSTVEGLDNLGLTNSGPGFFPALQRQMESQLLADPEMMCRLLNSPFVQNTLSNSSPQLARQLIQSNPQIQQLLQTNPEVEDMLNNTGVITQVRI